MESNIINIGECVLVVIYLKQHAFSELYQLRGERVLIILFFTEALFINAGVKKQADKFITGLSIIRVQIGT